MHLDLIVPAEVAASIEAAPQRAVRLGKRHYALARTERVTSPGASSGLVTLRLHGMVVEPGRVCARTVLDVANIVGHPAPDVHSLIQADVLTEDQWDGCMALYKRMGLWNQ